jgi:hypothetical protein
MGSDRGSDRRIVGADFRDGCSEIRKELPIRPKHVPGYHVMRQKLEQFADGQGTGMKTTNQNDGAIDQLAMDGGMFRGARKGAGRDNRFLLVEMLDEITHQSVNQRSDIIFRHP